MMTVIDTNMFKNGLLREVQALLDQTGQKHPPFNPELLAPYRKVIEIRRQKLMVPGILTPVKKGFIISLNSDDSVRRQRSTCAHEIAHTFFYDITTSPPSQIKVRGYKAKQFGLEEDTCNQLAEEILMPTHAVREVTAEFPHPLMKSFVKLMSSFDVSSELLAWRLRRLKVWRAIIILFAQKNFGARLTPVALTKESTIVSQHKDLAHRTWQPLQVWKVFKHPDYKHIRVRPGLPISENLSPVVAFRSGAEVVTKEYWELGGLKGDFLIQSRRFEGRPPHVASIVVPDDEYARFLLSIVPLQSQPMLF